jgi:hypothetical protein
MKSAVYRYVTVGRISQQKMRMKIVSGPWYQPAQLPEIGDRLLEFRGGIGVNIAYRVIQIQRGAKATLFLHKHPTSHDLAALSLLQPVAESYPADVRGFLVPEHLPKAD